MEKADAIIIGAGVVGLAIATALAKNNRSIIVIEKEQAFGQGASSRNSEIIHSGIYYPPNSLKARLCLEGKEMLYQFCQEQNIPNKRSGKIIVATDDKEAEELEELLDRGRNNGVKDLSLLTKDQVKRIEPEVDGLCAILSPSTGIVDSHQLMKRLAFLAENRGAVFAYGCEAVGIKKKADGYSVDIRDVDGEKLTLTTPIIINSAGLYSDKIARMAGIDIKRYGYELHYSKGEYFRVGGGKSRLLKYLVYPTPEEESLGIHTVMDIAGEMRLGPNAFYVDEIDYDVESAHRNKFYQSIKRFLPFIEEDDLSPDTAGIRAKLQAADEPVRDFVISEETNKGFPGLVNLIGIESPGLTCSLSIAKYIDSMV